MKSGNEHFDLRVLVVDDSTDNADAIALLLRKLGCTVRVVYDPTTALETAKEFRPRVAMLDIGMPEVDGYQLAREFRGSAGLETICLIAVSGYADKAHQARATESGFDGYIVKPYSIHELRDAIERLRPNQTRV